MYFPFLYWLLVVILLPKPRHLLCQPSVELTEYFVVIQLNLFNKKIYIILL